jgi:hypothetical protein
MFQESIKRFAIKIKSWSGGSPTVAKRGDVQGRHRQGCVINLLTELDYGMTPFDWALSFLECIVLAGDGAMELL